MLDLMPITLRIVEQTDKPFPYFLAEQFVPPSLENELLGWLEREAPWRLVETDFYEQYEFSLFEADLPAALAWLVSPECLAHLRGIVEKTLGCRLTDKTDLVAHKLLAGQRIGIHNDYLEGHETHRLTVQLNHGLTDNDGGFFMLFNSFDANDVHKILRPWSGSAVGFEISQDSHHAVSRMHGGERYTLVYSFYADRSAH